MTKKTSIWVRVGYTLLTSTIFAVALNEKPAIAQEMTLLLCETPSTTVRVYEEGNQRLMRAYNRQQKQVWMNRTPADAKIIANGIEYQNQLGELAVRIGLNTSTGGCSIRVNNQLAEQGTRLIDQTINAVVGTVTYRARIGLMKGSVVKAKLIDSGTTETVAEQTIVTQGEQVPIPFRLFYDPSEIDANRRYGVSAEIFVEDKLRWSTKTVSPVITENTPSVAELVVNFAEDAEQSEAPSGGPTEPTSELPPLPQAVEAAVKAKLIEEIGNAAVQVERYSRETWSDGCLGLGGPAESCLAALTEGWKVELIDTASGKRYVYRTNLNGDSVRRNPQK